MAERSFVAEIEDLRKGEGDVFTGEGILAITKALLECGVGYVGGYQGAPISHLMDVLADAEELMTELGVRFEANASEAAAAAMLAADATAELDGVGTECDVASVTLLPPIPNPDKILCIGLNYMAHITETGRDKPKYPAIFIRHPSSLVGHGTPLVRPKASQDFDYEGELAIVIGKAGRHITTDNAWDYIAGYTCFNDGSIRDFQAHTSQFWPGKSFESSGSMGPALVTSDDVQDVTQSTLTTRVNGNVEQNAGIDDLAFSIPEIIAYASTVIKLLPGDVIATGTPGGVGKFRKPQLYLEPGMSVDVEITGVGTLSNGIVDEV